MKLLALARGDLANLSRDPLLVLAISAPLPLALAFRLIAEPVLVAVAPWVQPEVVRTWMGALLLLLPPLLLGAVSAFLVIEERDEHVLPAVAATPLGISGLLRWRLSLPTFLALVAPLLTWPLSGFVNGLTVSPLALTLTGLGAALQTPATALLLIRLARDKIQGIALSKLVMAQILTPAALWLPGTLSFAAAPFPAFWLARALLYSSVADAAVGLGVTLIWLALAPRRVHYL